MVRVEKGKTATSVCKLLSYSGSKLTSLKISATTSDGGSESATTTTDKSVSLAIANVQKKWTVTCVATINGGTFTSSNVITFYGRWISFSNLLTPCQANALTAETLSEH
eukprot:sb/3477460/